MTINPNEAPAYMFRCTTCGRWSHAKDRPYRHWRWVRPGEDGYDQTEASKLQEPGVPEGHPVKCGPFITYYATTAQVVKQ